MVSNNRNKSQLFMFYSVRLTLKYLLFNKIKDFFKNRGGHIPKYEVLDTEWQHIKILRYKIKNKLKHKFDS